jgi:hypothetical protein
VRCHLLEETGASSGALPTEGEAEGCLLTGEQPNCQDQESGRGRARKEGSSQGSWDQLWGLGCPCRRATESGCDALPSIEHERKSSLGLRG